MTYAFDPELQGMVDMLAGMGLGNLEDVQAMRASMDQLVGSINVGLDTSGVTIDDRVVPGPDGDDVPVRVYVPDDASGAGLLYIHGGGFVMGNIETEHGSAVTVARQVGAVVVSVDYRLAPEHPFPAGIEDCYAALTWLHGSAADLGVDTARIGIMGMSAGGGLSAGLALLARDRGGPAICFQFLGIPELDDRLETPSMQAYTDTPMWDRPSAVLSWRYYLGDDPGDVSPYAAPARATDLSGLPPAYISTMEFDPLRDEGVRYGLALLAAGVSTELHSYPGTFHGSAIVTDAAVTRRSNVEMVEVLRRRLA